MTIRVAARSFLTQHHHRATATFCGVGVRRIILCTTNHHGGSSSSCNIRKQQQQQLASVSTFVAVSSSLSPRRRTAKELLLRTFSSKIGPNSSSSSTVTRTITPTNMTATAASTTATKAASACITTNMLENGAFTGSGNGKNGNNNNKNSETTAPKKPSERKFVLYPKVENNTNDTNPTARRIRVVHHLPANPYRTGGVAGARCFDKQRAAAKVSSSPPPSSSKQEHMDNHQKDSKTLPREHSKKLFNQDGFIPNAVSAVASNALPTTSKFKHKVVKTSSIYTNNNSYATRRRRPFPLEEIKDSSGQSILIPGKATRIRRPHTPPPSGTNIQDTVTAVISAAPTTTSSNSSSNSTRSSFAAIQPLPILNASALLDSKHYCRQSANAATSKSGTEAAKRLLRGKRDIVQVLRNHVVPSHHAWILQGHGVPEQLLQYHVDLADAVLFSHQADQCSFPLTDTTTTTTTTMAPTNATTTNITHFNTDAEARTHPAERVVAAWEAMGDSAMELRSRAASTNRKPRRTTPPPTSSSSSWQLDSSTFQGGGDFFRGSSSWPPPFPPPLQSNVESWQEPMELYLTVMNRLAASLAVVLRQPPSAESSLEDVEEDDPRQSNEEDDDFSNFVTRLPSSSSTAAAVGRVSSNVSSSNDRYTVRVEFHRGTLAPSLALPRSTATTTSSYSSSQRASSFLCSPPIVEWFPTETGGRVCIRLQGVPSRQLSPTTIGRTSPSSSPMMHFDPLNLSDKEALAIGRILRNDNSNYTTTTMKNRTSSLSSSPQSNLTYKTSQSWSSPPSLRRAKKSTVTLLFDASFEFSNKNNNNYHQLPHYHFQE